MADLLTQLQDAVDQLANQFVASLFYVHKHHDYQKLSPTDHIRQDPKNNEDGAAPKEQDVIPFPADVFKAGQRELAQDLILKEQQIEYLISSLPGLANSEKDQEEIIRQLEEELRTAEVERKEAIKDKDDVLNRLEGIIRSVKRP
ncbi:hypothetical protein PZA11_001838 [Diplocarpon coronariae]|uniref:Mediator of RNA polymerase II transcription subunit 21 n=1 Tax=Diplocarpon coronariae TaxID=2795749 RepID=A0A218ZBU3_9HELO|nr:hypothetical protein JHW43_008855 [Diplocarpon mali]OWP05551.1 hypothetical protein B2J93_7895 [Marssonina coronariae]